jgi:c-di-AMP phosphodiesterase-like protein
MIIVFFADIDSGELAKWFEYTASELINTKKQYVTTININNYEDMKRYLSDEQKIEFDNKVVIKLLSDESKNKLLGIDFDKQRKLSS